MDPTNQPEPAPYPNARSADILRTYLAEHGEDLLPVIGSFVARFSTARNEHVREVAHEILNEVTVRALSRPERFDHTRLPKAWLLSIAVNLVFQRRDASKRLNKHEVSVDVAFNPDRDASEIDTFDRLAYHAYHPDEENSAMQKLAELLARATSEDRELLTRIDLEEWNYVALAQKMGIPAATLRKRHQRAIQRIHRLASQEGGQHT